MFIQPGSTCNALDLRPAAFPGGLSLCFCRGLGITLLGAGKILVVPTLRARAALYPWLCGLCGKEPGGVIGGHDPSRALHQSVEAGQRAAFAETVFRRRRLGQPSFLPSCLPLGRSRKQGSLEPVRMERLWALESVRPSGVQSQPCH